MIDKNHIIIFNYFKISRKHAFALFKYKYDSRIDVDNASSDAGDHEESLMTDEKFTLVYFALPQVHYEKTMDIF